MPGSGSIIAGDPYVVNDKMVTYLYIMNEGVACFKIITIYCVFLNFYKTVVVVNNNMRINKENTEIQERFLSENSCFSDRIPYAQFIKYSVMHEPDSEILHTVLIFFGCPAVRNKRLWSFVYHWLSFVAIARASSVTLRTLFA